MADDRRNPAIQRELFMRTLTVARPRGPAAAAMSRVMKEVSFRAGDTIYRAGEPALLVYFVARGVIELRSEGLDPWRFDPPSVVGVLDTMQRRPRARTAVAITDVDALQLHSDDWFDVLEDDFEFTRETLIRVAADVHRMHLETPPDGAFAVPSADAARAGEARGHDLLERTITLRSVPVLQRASVQAIARLAALVTEVQLAPGDVLFRAGEPIAAFHVVASGVIGATCHDPLGGPPRIVAAFGPGSIVGGGAVIGVTEHAAEAVARSAATVLALDREHLFDVLEDHFEAARAILVGLGGERELILNRRASQGKPP